MKQALSGKRIAFGVVAAIVLSYVALCGVLYGLQGVVLYHPQPLLFAPDAPALTIAAPSGALHGWIVNANQPDALVYFGGNGEPVERDVAIFRTLLPERCIYLVPYRGYGPNPGTPSEATIEADALAVFDFARARHAKVAVIGRSLGSGVATFVAAHRLVDRLVLVTPYDSILNIARERYGIFPVFWLLRDHWESWRSAEAIQVPTLVLVAADDEVIPRENSDALIAHLHPQPTVVTIPDADHNNLSNSSIYKDTLRAFLTPPASLPTPPH